MKELFVSLKNKLNKLNFYFVKNNFNKNNKQKQNMK